MHTFLPPMMDRFKVVDIAWWNASKGLTDHNKNRTAKLTEVEQYMILIATEMSNRNSRMA